MALPSHVKNQPPLPLSLARQEVHISHDELEGNVPVCYLAANPPERIIVGDNIFDRGNNDGIEGAVVPTIVLGDVVCGFNFAT